MPVNQRIDKKVDKYDPCELELAATGSEGATNTAPDEDRATKFLSDNWTDTMSYCS